MCGGGITGRVIRAAFSRRLNGFDVVVIILGLRLLTDGHLLAAIVVCLSGAFVSNLGEGARERLEGDRP